MSRTAAASTMLRMTNFLMALSLGTQRAQLVQRMGCTCPRPFLARPLLRLFRVCGGRGSGAGGLPHTPCQSPPPRPQMPPRPYGPPAPRRTAPLPTILLLRRRKRIRLL